MRLHRFHISEKIGEQTEITINSAELVNQVGRVFRLGKGDRIIVFDDSGFDFECEITNIEKSSLFLKITKSEPSRYMPSRNVYLYQALVKKDNFEWIVEKATELGVTHIIPVMAEHSEKKSLNEERLKKIAIEASEQSGRGNVSIISPIISFEEAVTARSNLAGETSQVKRYFFHTEGEITARSNQQIRLLGRLAEGPVAIFIGPEGGWSEKEVEMFHANNIEIYCLGRQVLRSETAVIAALSQVVY